MKALVVTAPGQLSLQEIPMPRMGPYDCLVKIDACAICTGTDSDIIAGSFPWLNPYPFVLGHESTGLISALGERVRRFRKGQRVTRPAAIYGGESAGGLFSTWGGFAEFGLVRDVDAAAQDGVPSSSMCSASRNPLPEGLSPVEAALSINQREILSVVRRMSLSAASTVVVIGSGYNGLLFALFGKVFGAGRVVMAGSPGRQELATTRFRVDELVDYHHPQVAQSILELACDQPTEVIDAIGSVQSLALARQVLKPGTAFGCYGVRDLNATQAVRQELAGTHPVLDMTTDEAGCVEEWYQLWQAGFFAQPGMVDAILPLGEYRQAFDRLAKREAVKIVLSL